MTINHYLKNSSRYINYNSNFIYTLKYINHYMIHVNRYHHFNMYIKYLSNTSMPKIPKKYKDYKSSYVPLTPIPPPPPPRMPPPPPPPYLKKNSSGIPFNYKHAKNNLYKYTKDGSSQTTPNSSSIFYLPPIKDKKYTSVGTDINPYDSLFNNIIKNISSFNLDKDDKDISSINTPDSSGSGEDIVVDKIFEILEGPIETIEDLIRIGNDYKEKYSDGTKRYNLDVKRLSNMVDELSNLNNMIGMNNIKLAIFNKIILTLQGLDNKNLDYNHIVLYGSPGMGKTHVAKIIGEIYSKMGFLSVGNFEQAKLTDLKAGYLGQTEIKTQKLLDKCKGSILFIDEAYSIGAEDKIDSFSQGIIDIINPFLDKHKDDFVLIIAGYKDELNNRFFRGNQGLKSRFGLWLEIDKYTAEDLFKIFQIKVKEYEWTIGSGITEKFFKGHIDNFPYFGRDIENFFSKCKIEHAKRVLFLAEDDKKKLNITDIEKGLELFIKDSGTNKDEEEAIKLLHSGLYS